MNDAVKRMLQRYDAKSRADFERAIREVLQEITLVGLWRGKFFEHAAFYGGTALRILYGLDRFSEDLDFTLLDPKSSFEWSSFTRCVTEELSSYGFEVNFIEKKKQSETAVRSAFLKTNTLNALMQVGIKESLNPDALIRVKVEIDTNPILGFETETVFLKEPMPVSIRAVGESSLFAGKVHAALYRAWKQRVKGRDWYDLVWFLRRNIPLYGRYLEACLRHQGDLDSDRSLTAVKVKELLIQRLESISFEALKEDVRPFLRDPSELDLWSIEFFHHWIDQLRLA